MNIKSIYEVKGHLQIEKVWKDRNKPSEIIYDDSNQIVSGMGVGLSMLFTLSGSDTITDYQFDRFQVGVSGAAENVASSVYELSGPLSSAGEYEGTGSNILVVSANQLKNGSNVADQVMALIPFKQVTRINDTSVRYTIILDDEAANDITRDGSLVPLNEVGLLMKNPAGLPEDQSILCAYKVFSDQYKTNEFSLIFRWVINL